MTNPLETQEHNEWKDHVDPPLQENRLNMDDFNNVFKEKDNENA